MEEFVYKLKLPPLSEILIDPSLILTDRIPRKAIHAKDIVKPEWLYWNKMYWNHCVYFFRSFGLEDRSNIHIDNGNKNFTVWGINWVNNGYGTMEYWRANQIEFVENFVLQDSTPILRCMTTQPAYKTYNMYPGAYLINSTLPHRATGYNNRFVLSLRSSVSYKLSWTEVVNKFENYIE